MTININNNPAFKGAGQAGAAAKGAAKKVLTEIPNGKELASKNLSSFLKSVNKNVSSPEQRLIMGVTALFSQPFIDLNNKRVNEETRLMSFARTMAKIVVGTTVGVLVRKESIRLAHKYTKMVSVPNVNRSGYWAKPAKENSFLCPAYVRNFTKDYHKNYVNALGSMLGIGVSLVTNFLIDAPLTQIMTNHCYKLLKDDSANSKPVESRNLLKEALNEQKEKGKNVSFGAANPVKAATEIKEMFTKIDVPRGAKFEPAEGLDATFHGLDWLKLWFWRHVAVNPGGMLMHTAALGWGASSAAQITGMLFNDKIDSNKKKFLIPQELADAAGNIALYYALTAPVKAGVERLFENGKIRIKSVMDSIESEGRKKKLQIDKLFGVRGVKVSDGLKNLPNSKELYLAHKNGASILATLVASVISCNVLTPYFRNFYGAYCQEKLKERSAKMNAVIFDINARSDKFRPKIDSNPAFDKFIV